MSRIAREHLDLFIGGRWVATASNDRFETVLPHTGSTATFLLPSVLDIDDALNVAHLACRGVWTSMTGSERATVIDRLRGTFERHRDRAVACTMGEAAVDVTLGGEERERSQIGRIYDLGSAEAGSYPMAPAGGSGGVAVIAPSQGASIAALMATLVDTLSEGCSVIVNMTVESVSTGRLIGDLVSEAGIPDGVASVLSTSDPMSRYLITHPDVDTVITVDDDRARSAVAA